MAQSQEVPGVPGTRDKICVRITHGGNGLPSDGSGDPATDSGNRGESVQRSRGRGAEKLDSARRFRVEKSAIRPVLSANRLHLFTYQLEIPSLKIGNVGSHKGDFAGISEGKVCLVGETDSEIQRPIFN